MRALIIKPQERDYFFPNNPSVFYNRLELMIELGKRTRAQTPWRPRREVSKFWSNRR